MKFLSGRGLLLAGAEFLASGAVLLLASEWLREALSAGLDISGTSSSSLLSWQSITSAADGLSLGRAYEPISLYRPLGLVALAATGSLFAARRLIKLSRVDPPIVDDQALARITTTGRQVDKELDNVLALFRTHIEKVNNHSAVLARGQTTLEVAKTGEQVGAVIKFLVTENEEMRRNNAGYEQKLTQSRTQIETLRLALKQAEETTARDPLTNTFSRRHFDVAIVKEVAEAQRSQAALSLIMADIDDFKKINDTFGHPVGDAVIQQVADLMTASTKQGGCVARYGGEEFAIVLPATPAHEAACVAEDIRKKLETQRWVVKGGPRIGRVTASFGVSQLKSDEASAALIARADAKLYESKAAGRNRVSK